MTKHPFVATPNNGTCSSCGKRRSDSIHDYLEDDDSDPPCTNPSGHEWVGPSEDYDRVYCIWCGADGDA